MSLSTFLKPSAVATVTLLLSSTLGSGVSAAENCATTWKCLPIANANAPVLDGDLSDWVDVVVNVNDAAYKSTLNSPITSQDYVDESNFKCVYDDNRIYFSLEIPGDYRFNATDNKKCAAIATMTKVGVDATYVNMGGCPDAMGGCPDGVPDTCETYRVDIGAHWELRTTEQGVAYNVPETTGIGGTVPQQPTVTTPAAGDDPIANNDDEYSVSPYCRFDDNDANADNEWAGAWAHTNPVEGEFGTYKFEISRSLKTSSVLTDAQYTPGSVSSFGVAFWDPFETENGWTDAGHFVTGCSTKWIDLELVTPPTSTNGGGGDTEQDTATNGGSTTSSAGSGVVSRTTAILVAVAGMLL